MIRSTGLAVALGMVAGTASAAVIQLDFTGLVETSNFGVPGTVDSGADGAVSYTATALFDTTVGAPGVDVFGRRTFADALTGFTATFSTGDVVTLNQPGAVRQSQQDRIEALFGDGGSAIADPNDALDGTVNGLEAVFGNFEIASTTAVGPDLFTDIDLLLSAIGTDVVTFDETSFDSFELSFDRPGSFARGLIIADIAEGSFRTVGTPPPPPTPEPPLPNPEPPLPPAPVPLPASGLLLLGAVGLLGLRRRG